MNNLPSGKRGNRFYSIQLQKMKRIEDQKEIELNGDFGSAGSLSGYIIDFDACIMIFS